MKKLLLLSLSLVLVIACQKAENILGINPDAPQNTGAGNLPTVTVIIPAYGASMTDNNGSQSGIQGKIEVTFSDFMNEATLTTDNIVILNTRTGEEISVDEITTEYYPEIQKLFIYIDDVPDSGVYLLRFVSGPDGMKNSYNSPLDFDLDNFADGTPYDDYHSTFWTAPLLDTLVVVTQPKIDDFSPDTIASPDQQPFIDIDFDLPMDTTTLNTNNIVLKNESGAAQACSVITKSLTGITLQPKSNLTMGENYTITILCDDIKGTGDFRTPEYFLKLDGDDDGPEEIEPDLQSYFRVDSATYTPKITNITGIAGAEGATFTFTRLLNDLTVTLNTIKVYDNTGYVPGELRIYANPGNNYTIVDYYYKRTIGAGRSAFVSKDIMATNDYYFDGDGNGIGGEPWDDLYTGF